MLGYARRELHERERERKTKEDTAPLTRLSNLSQCGEQNQTDGHLTVWTSFQNFSVLQTKEFEICSHEVIFFSYFTWVKCAEKSKLKLKVPKYVSLVLLHFLRAGKFHFYPFHLKHLTCSILDGVLNSRL